MATESASASSSNPSSSSLYSYPAATYFPLPFHLQNADPAAQQQYLPPSQIPPPVKIPTMAQTFPVPPPVVAGMYSLPQFQQAQQLFQRDAQTITPEAIEVVKAALANSEVDHKSDTKKKAIPRKAAGHSWEDPTLAEWPENDFRLFCGDLGNEVNDDVLSKAFSRFPSFNMARVKLAISPVVSVVRICGKATRFYRSPKSIFKKDMLQGDKMGNIRTRVRDKKLRRKGKSFVCVESVTDVIRDKRTGKTKGYGFVSFSNPSDLAAAVKEMNGKYVGNRPIKLRKSTWRERTDVEALERQKNYIQKKPKLPKKGILHK